MLIFFTILFPLAGRSQPRQFTKDSIPTSHGKVVFHINFKSNLSENEFHKRAYFYLENILSPVDGIFLTDNDQSTICKVTDYISIDNGLFQKFGMYMTYDIQFGYKMGACSLVIHDIEYMEKGSFDARKNSHGEIQVKEWSGSDILVDEKYHLLFIKNVSERITIETLKRINGIISDLYASFERKGSPT